MNESWNLKMCNVLSLSLISFEYSLGYFISFCVFWRWIFALWKLSGGNILQKKPYQSALKTNANIVHPWDLRSWVSLLLLAVTNLKHGIFLQVLYFCESKGYHILSYLTYWHWILFILQWLNCRFQCSQQSK